jgi:hypothetical protein
MASVLPARRRPRRRCRLVMKTATKTLARRADGPADDSGSAPHSTAWRSGGVAEYKERLSPDLLRIDKGGFLSLTSSCRLLPFSQASRSTQR